MANVRSLYQRPLKTIDSLGEELAFFVVVPICGLLTYEAVGRVLSLVRRRSRVGEAGPRA